MLASTRPADPPTGLVSDTRSLDALKRRAATDPQGAVRAVAKQFEALFMQELMKSMRASTLASGLLDNEGSKLGSEMLDSQLSTQMTGLPGGLSDAIARQLERQMGLAPGPIPTSATSARPASLAPLGAEARPVGIPQRGAAAFVQQHTASAQRAEAATGIPAAFMVAQAAHESGWGRKEILHADGTPSHNLFGIKAGAGWNGPVAEVRTTEYVDGQPRSVTARFRAYASHAESFADYARLMTNSPRYRPVLAQAGSAEGFAQGLQQAGYATDPAYADKLSRVINTTLRLQRSTS
jgi:flagellar protein FlgJ